MRQSFLFCFLLSLAATASAQIFEQDFFPTSMFYGLTATSDGHYVAVGTQGTTSENKTVYLYKVTAAGTLIWEKNILPAGISATGFSVLSTADNGFVITGFYVGDWPADDGSFVVKTSADGTVEWTRILAGELYTAAALDNGGFLVGGVSETYGQSAVYELAADGSLVWVKSYQGTNYRGAVMQIFLQDDGSFIAAGRGEVTGAGFRGIFLIHADSNGEQIWEQSLNTGNSYQDLDFSELGPLGAVQSADGSILIADGQGVGALVMVKYSTNGELLWQKTLGNTNVRYAPFAMTADSDGNLFVAGSTVGQGNYRQPFLIKSSNAGEELWARNYTFPATLNLTGVVVRADGTCMTAGQNSENQYAYLAGYGPDGFNDPNSASITLKIDMDGDCMVSAGDIPVKDAHIVLKGTATFILTTDANGIAQQPVPYDVYEISVQMPSGQWTLCEALPVLTVPANGGPVFNKDILLKPVDNCPQVSVSLTAPYLVRCEAGIFYVECHNLGTATATDVKVKVKADPLLHLESAGLPYTIDGDALEFALGEVGILERKRFAITYRLDCNATIGQTHCVEAIASPVLPCAMQPGPGWSGASLQTTAECTGTHVLFTVTNAGAGNMSQPSPYRMYADGWLVESGDIQLDAGQAWTRNYGAYGRSVWMEVNQVPGHPGNDRPVAGVEGCSVTDNGFMSTGFLNMFEQNGRDAHRSYVCVENSRAGLPDKISGIPKGYSDSRKLDVQSRPEYIVSVQNTSQETVSRVRVQLQISEAFDPATLYITASSHPYQIKSTGNHTFEILFEPISLPSATQDSLNSRVYFRYTALPENGTLEGVGLSNSAKAYFGADGYATIPVLTQSTFILAGGVSSVQSPVSNHPRIQVFPGSSGTDFCHSMVTNPDSTTFLITSTGGYGNNNDLVLIKTDANGRGIWQKVFDFGGSDQLYESVSDGAGGLVITGSLAALGSYTVSNLFLLTVRIDSAGHVLWVRKEKPGTGQGGRGGVATGIIRNTEGDFVITGVLSNGLASSIDAFLLKIDPSGETIWMQNYLLAGVAFYPEGVAQTPDGGYLIAGNDQADFPAPKRVQRVDASGNTIWEKSYEALELTDPYELLDFTLTPDGGFAWVTYTIVYDNNNNDFYYPMITKLDQDGVPIWQKTIAIGTFTWVTDLVTMPDGRFVFTGEITEGNLLAGSQLLIGAADVEGNLLWWHGYDANTSTTGFQVAPVFGDQFLLTGYTQNNNTVGNMAAVLIRTGPDGVLNTQGIPAAESMVLGLWPNPARDHLLVKIPGASNSPVQWQLLHLNGQVVSEGAAAGNDFRIQLPELPAGMYRLSVENVTGKASKAVFIGR